MQPVLVVGGEKLPIDLPDSVDFSGQKVPLRYCSYSQVTERVFAKDFSLVVLFADASQPLLSQILKSFREITPQSPLVLAADKADAALVRLAINSGHAILVVKSHELASDWSQVLERPFKKHLLFLNSQNLVRESARQNRQLEALTASLEQVVEERTQHITVSNVELSEKLARERQIVRFIKDAAVQVSTEDLLQVLRRELKKFHKTGEPILVYTLAGRQTYVCTFVSGSFIQVKASVLPTGSDIFREPRELLKVLANALGRPLAKAHVAEIELQLMALQMPGSRAFLVVENSLHEQDLQSFSDAIHDRLQALGMALDRLLLEGNLALFSYRWARTFDGLKDPIAIIDSEYNVVMSNRQFSSKLFDKKCFEKFAGREAPCLGCPLPQTLETKKAQSSDLQVGSRQYQVHSYPVKSSEEGSIANVVHQYEDVTEKRKLYLQVVQNEKMGAIGALAGNIAHELNNPLSGIRSLSQVLLREVTKDPQLHKDLEEIEKAAARSQKIIVNLLNFAKSNDQLKEKISLDEVVEKTLPMLKTALRMHRLQLFLQTPKALVEVEPHLMQQVVFNLVNNACQAMRDIGDLTIQTQVQGKVVQLVIEDTGPGIPEEVASRIFDPFFTTKSEGQGTGLGLSLVKSIVEKYNGNIRFENKSGGGARFIVELPVQKKA